MCICLMYQFKNTARLCVHLCTSLKMKLGLCASLCTSFVCLRKHSFKRFKYDAKMKSNPLCGRPQAPTHPQLQHTGSIVNPCPMLPLRSGEALAGQGHSDDGVGQGKKEWPDPSMLGGRIGGEKLRLFKYRNSYKE